MKRYRLAAICVITLSLLGSAVVAANTDMWVSLFCVAAMAAAAVVLVIYENPAPLFVAFFFINYVMFVDGGRPSTYVLMGMLCLFSPLFLFLKKPARVLPLFLPVLLALLYYASALLFKPYDMKASWVLLHIEAAIVFTVTQFFTWSVEKIANVSKLHMLALTAFGIIELALFYQDRIIGPMLSATAYGILLVVAWSTWFSYEVLSVRPRYGRIAVYTVLALIVMVATGTRAAVIGAVVTFALTLSVRIFAAGDGPIGNKILKFGIYGSAAALLIVGVWTLLPQELTVKKNFQLLLRGEVDYSNLGRLFVWYCAVQAFKSSPLLGIGNGNFLQFLQQNYGHLPIPELYLTLPHAHNATLVILSENGIVGITVALIIVGMALLQLIRHIKRTNTPKSAYSLIIGFAVMYILSMFDALPYYPSSMVWIAWLLGAVVQLPAERKPGAIVVESSNTGA